MLASRRGTPKLNHSWPFGRLEASSCPFPFPVPPRKTSSSPRMSNTGFETPLSSATEWTGQYALLPPAEPIFASQPFSHISSGPADAVSISVTSGGSGACGGSIGVNPNSNANSTSYSTSMASTASTTPSDGVNTTVGALVGNSGQSQTRPSSSSNGGDGNASAKASSASPLDMHNHRGLDPPGLRQSSHIQPPAGDSIRSPPTPTSDHHGGQVQHLQHHHHHHHYQQPQQPQHPRHHPHSSNSHDISPMLSNALSGSMPTPLSAVLQLPGIMTRFGGTHSMSSMSSMNSMNSINSINSMSNMGGMNSISHMNSMSMRTDMGHGGDHRIKEEDEDMLDGEDMGSAGEPQTGGERIPQRRKMKRFRLTHQQTRFLMSEFAKQPHPDAAHRERLSREIPGLSPRQVQVWFQNRRAKIKRVAADDRERMIKMRAVPDTFDSVQALHSPYGAVHGLGTPMASPVDFAAAAASPYGDHMMRPLMVDVRRAEGDDHMSPSGLSPAFGGIGFNPPGAMSSSDILSPLSPTSSSDHHRYGSYSGQLSTAASAASASTTGTVGGTRTALPYARPGTGNIATGPNNTGTSGGSSSNSSSANSTNLSTNLHHHHQRHPVRPLQPLQLRETMSRSRSDNLQSPLRSSMSWKGDALDYNSYHAGSDSPQLAGRSQQQQPLYQSDAGTSFDNPYSGSTARSPTMPLSYQSFPALGLQATSPSRSLRLRAASATLPLALDLTSGGRSIAARSSLASSSSYSAHCPTSSPLTAPLSYGMSRTLSAGYGSSLSGTGYRPGTTDSASSDYAQTSPTDAGFSHELAGDGGNTESQGLKRKHSFT